MKACKHCHNEFEDDQIEMHLSICAQNPDVQEKAKKAGELEAFVKTVVLKDGEIVRMYWAHSTGAQDFEIEPVLSVWQHKWPNEQHTSLPFLRARGFRVLITQSEEAEMT